MSPGLTHSQLEANMKPIKLCTRSRRYIWKGKEMKKIKVRQYASLICDKFEELLDEFEIDIPDDGREGDECEAHIYGCTYYELEDKVKEVLVCFANAIKRDDIELEEYEY